MQLVKRRCNVRKLSCQEEVLLQHFVHAVIIRIIRIVGKERCIKEHIVSELLYVSCVYLTSYVFKNCFCVVKFRAKFEVFMIGRKTCKL